MLHTQHTDPDTHLKYHARTMFFLFLKALGMTMVDAVRYMDSECSKKFSLQEYRPKKGRYGYQVSRLLWSTVLDCICICAILTLS